MIFLKTIPLKATLQFFLTLSLVITMATGLSSCSLIGAAFNLAAYAAGSAVQIASIKGIFSCLPEGTQIDTPDGTQSVESLKAGDKAIGYSGKIVTIKQIHAYDEDAEAAKFMTIEFQNGAKVDLCEMHRIGGIRAKDLQPGDKTSSGHTVTLITRYIGVERSYDLITEDSGYRIGGVPVNSMIEEMLHASETGKIKD